MIRSPTFRALLIPFLFLAPPSTLARDHDRLTPLSPPLLDGRYRLAEGSTLTVDWTCPPPAVVLPLRGRLWVHSRVDNLCSRLYGIKSMDFYTLGEPAYAGTGRGELHLSCREAEVGPFGELRLWVTVRVPEREDEEVVLHGGPVPMSDSLPWVEIDVTQVWPEPGPCEPFYRMHIAATPWPELWLTTEVGFTASSMQKVSDGDLLNSLGRVVRTNQELTARLGIKPLVPDLGLDGVVVGDPAGVTSGEILFSTEVREFSEILGPLGHGDLLGESGRIVRRNRDLLVAFAPELQVDRDDYGLDGVSAGPTGLFLFSTEDDFFSLSLGERVRHGDLLEESGTIVKRNRDLLARFRPGPLPVPGDLDFGLDAVHAWPHGEVWFSTEVAFNDLDFGPVGHGDLLSDRGRLVARNYELLAGFGPLEDLDDFGLDALRPALETTFAACGTLVEGPQGGCILFEVAGGERYLLENQGGFEPGDDVWVMGILDESCAWVCLAPCIRDNAIESCLLERCGVLVQYGSCVVFQPEGGSELYSLDNYDGFGPGDPVRVAGILDPYSNPCGVMPPTYAGFIEANEISACTVPPPCDPPEGIFVRGDSDRDGELTLNDAVVIFRWLFMGGPPPCSGGPDSPALCCCYDVFDANDTGTIDLSDGIRILRFLFLGGRPLPPPFPGCGTDPTDDDLACEGDFCAEQEPAGVVDNNDPPRGDGRR